MEIINETFCYAEYKEILLGVVVKGMKEKIKFQISISRFRDKSSFADFYIRYSEAAFYSVLRSIFVDNGFDDEDSDIYAKAARKQLLMWLERDLESKMNSNMGNINWSVLREDI